MGCSSFVSSGGPEIIRQGQANYIGPQINPISLSGISIGAAASDRLIIAVISWAITGASRTLTSVTIGGVAATLYAPAVGARECALAWVPVPTGTTANVVITWDGGVSNSAAILYSMTGQASNTPIAQDFASAPTISGISGTLSLGAVADEAEMIVGCADLTSPTSLGSPVTDVGTIAGSVVTYGQVRDWPGGTLSFAYGTTFAVTAAVWL